VNKCSALNQHSLSVFAQNCAEECIIWLHADSKLKLYFFPYCFLLISVKFYHYVKRNEIIPLIAWFGSWVVEIRKAFLPNAFVLRYIFIYFIILRRKLDEFNIEFNLTYTWIFKYSRQVSGKSSAYWLFSCNKVSFLNYFQPCDGKWNNHNILFEMSVKCM
jgi:hypothetical protein